MMTWHLLYFLVHRIVYFEVLLLYLCGVAGSFVTTALASLT